MAALAIVARYHGIDICVDELRRNYVLQDGEPPGATLASIGRELGLQIRPMKMRWRDLLRISRVLPAILRSRDGMALLLDAVDEDKTAGQVAILRDPRDPTGAQAAVDEARLAELWDGEVILVKRCYALGDEERPFGLAWLAGRLLHERRMFRDIVISALINTIFVLTPPVVARIVLDKVLTGHSSATLTVLATFFGLVVIFEMVTVHLRSLFLEVIAARIDGRINLHIMEKLIKLPVDYFERNSTGRITNKLYATWHLRNFLTGQMFRTLLDLVTSIVLMPILFIISWQLAILVMMWAAIIFLIVLCSIRPLTARHLRVVAAEQEKAAYLTETVYGMRTIKSLALEGRRRMGWDARVGQAVWARFDLGRMSHYVMTLSSPFERLIASGSLIIGAALYLYYVGLLSQPQPAGTAGFAESSATAQSLLNSLQPGLLVAFAMLASTAASPLMRVGRLMLEINEVRAAVSQVASIVNTRAEETRAGTGLRLPIRGGITFKNVRFRYSPGAPFALDGLSFEIQPGTILGIMGRSGSGKTTITRLLQELDPNYEGIVKIDGMDLREIDLQYLRSNIGVVAQENFLFTGTIRENIGIGRPAASLAEIMRAAQLAGAEEFIEKLPRGYNTMLEEGATNLSGGQRQRLAIARALVLDPPVLILDEATSALDAESEAMISANLMRIAQGRTIICVSHRLSMLVPSHSILVMEKGRLYDIGGHEDLLHRCDIYRNMWYQQNRHIDPGASYEPIAIAHSAQA